MTVASLQGFENGTFLCICVLPCAEADSSYVSRQLCIAGSD